jgi:hypothetical protein
LAKALTDSKPFTAALKSCATQTAESFSLLVWKGYSYPPLTLSFNISDIKTSYEQDQEQNQQQDQQQPQQRRTGESVPHTARFRLFYPFCGSGM